MEKTEIVSKFFENSQLLTPSALEEIALQGKVPEISKEKFIIDRADLEEDDIRILKNLESRPKEVNTDMFLKFYTSKYNKMREIFTSRFKKDFVSLNKVDNSRSEVMIFGIVKEAKDKTIELEDLTSSVSVVFQEATENVERDDAIAVEGTGAGKVVYGKKIFFADVPLRTAVTGKGKACFVSDMILNEIPQMDVEKFFAWFQQEDIKYLFICGRVDKSLLEKMIFKYCTNKKVFVAASGDKEEYPHLPLQLQGNITSLSDPCMVEINGVKILVIHKFDISMLRKRYLGKSRTILPDDYLVLEEVPDIVHCGHTQKPHTSNYKSVSIVNSGSLLDEFKPVVIDFATREVKQISL